MTYEIYDELVLTAEETASFVNNMLHPNTEACMRGEEFLRDLPDLHFDLNNGEIIANCPDIQLPNVFAQEEHSIYDDKQLQQLEWIEGKIEFEESEGMELSYSSLYKDNRQPTCAEPLDADRWMGSGNWMVAMIPEAA